MMKNLAATLNTITKGIKVAQVAVNVVPRVEVVPGTLESNPNPGATLS